MTKKIGFGVTKNDDFCDIFSHKKVKKPKTLS